MDGRRFLRQNFATVGSSLGVVLANIDFYFQWPTIFFVRWAKLYFFLRRWPTFSVLVDADTEWRPNIDKSTNLSITKWVFPYLFSISRRTTLCFFFYYCSDIYGYTFSSRGPVYVIGWLWQSHCELALDDRLYWTVFIEIDCFALSDHVSSTDDTRKTCSSSYRKKCPKHTFTSSQIVFVILKIF